MNEKGKTCYIEGSVELNVFPSSSEEVFLLNEFKNKLYDLCQSYFKDGVSLRFLVEYEEKKTGCLTNKN